ncbi:MAG: hypothetical protein AAFR87_03035 [Bacteroidota bacterium]
MHYRAVYLVIFLVLGQLNLGFGQNIEARLDLKRKDPKPDFFEYSPTDGGLVTLGPTSNVSSRFLGITKYDDNLEKEWTQKVLEQNGRKNVDFVTVIGPYIFVFVSEFVPKDGIIKTYYYSFDMDGELLEEERILAINPNKREHKVDLQYILSPNKRKLMAFKNLQNNREAEEILYYIFDDEGELVQNGEFTIRYPDNRFAMRSLRVSNSGNIFVLGQFVRNNNIRDADASKYLIYRYDLDTEEGIEFPIELEDRFITDLAFRLDRDENMYVAGFYSNRNSEQIAGTVMQKISIDGDLLINAHERFDESFLRNFLSRGKVRKGGELRNFRLDSQDGIVLRSDGGILLIAEKFFVTSQTYRDIYGYWVDRDFFHFEEVILTSISGTGEIEWHSIVDKNQISEDPSNLSYFNAFSSSGTHIFYEYRPNRNRFNVYYNTIGIEGEVSDRQALFREYSESNEFFPRFCQQINSREALMVYMQNRGKVFSVVKVALME